MSKQRKGKKKNLAETLKGIDKALDTVLSIITKLTLLAMGIKTFFEVMISIF